MIAKLITHGATRAGALRRRSAALRDCEVAGTVTNLAFLGALAGHDGFAVGDVDTDLIARDLEDLVVEPQPEPRDIALAALAAMGLLQNTDSTTGFRLWTPLTQTVHLHRQGDDIAVRVQSLSAVAHDVQVGDATVAARRVGDRWQLDGQAAPNVVVSGALVTVFDRYGIGFDSVDPLDRAAMAAGDQDVIEAPMPGLVKQVTAKPGQEVREGDRLAVLEAMKMEHSLLAARDGTVEEVLVVEGAQVAAGAALIRLASGESERSSA